MNIHFNNLEMLHLLWVIPVLIFFYIYASYKRRQALEIFANIKILDKINITLNRGNRVWKMILILLAFVFIILGLTRPGWNPKSKKIVRKGRDVVFLLDVSKSMLAQDLKPSRLELAKIAIMDCIEQLQGDRVGLVAFSGTSTVKCPLTLDYGFFKMMLKDLDTNSIARGGTLIGDALRKILNEVFDNKEKKFKDIILITDGEDHDSFPVEASQEVKKQGIRLIIVGLGDDKEGKRIPIIDKNGYKTFLTYNGKEIWSKLDSKTLTMMSSAVGTSEGNKRLFFHVGPNESIDLGKIYKKLIASAEKRLLKSKSIKHYEEKFQIFISIAFFLLCLELLIKERK